MNRFRDALAVPGLAAIAEVKRRSPSAGDLRPDADPARLAAQFANADAAAISILVDERFGGSLEDLKAARAATAGPLLAKGFFTEELDLLKAKVAGADAVLILLRDVDDQRAAALISYARELGIETLVEAHDANELHRALALGAEVIGVNARDLTTFELDRRRQLELVARMRDQDAVVVAESGVHTRAQGAAAELAGASAAVTPCSCATASRSHMSSISRGTSPTRSTCNARWRVRVASCSPGGSARTTCVRPCARSARGRSTPRRSSRPSPGSRITTRC